MRSRDTITCQQGNFLSTISSSTVTIQPQMRRCQRWTTRGRPGDTEGGTRWAYKVRPLFLFFIFYFTYFNSTPSSPNMFPSMENAPTRHSCRPQLIQDVPHLLNTSPHPEHQNVPLWARSGVPSSPPSFQTPESAHVGTFWCSRTSPLPSPSRTPERARTGMFWCLHTSPLPLPRLEHQNEPMCGLFWCLRTSALSFSRLEH